MRRGILSIGLLMALSLAGAVPAGAASAITLTARPFQSPGPQDDVVVAANVSPADGVTSIDLVYRYDAARLTPVNVYRTGMSKNFTLGTNLATSGFIEIHMSGVAPLTG